MDKRKRILVDKGIVKILPNESKSARSDKEKFFVRIKKNDKKTKKEIWFYKVVDTLEEAIELRDNFLQDRDVERNFEESDYPLNLIDKLLSNTDYDRFDLSDVIKNFDARLNLCANYYEIISERELELLMLRYKKGLTLEAIGKKYLSCSKERVRQIELHSFRKLRIVLTRKILFENYFETERLRNRLEQIRHEYEVKICEYQNKLRELKLSGIKIENEIDCMDRSIFIEEFDFTVRTYNCLKRFGVNNSGDLMKLKKDDLIGIRNLGRKSIKEIQEKMLERCGFEFSE